MRPLDLPNKYPLSDFEIDGPRGIRRLGPIKRDGYRTEYFDDKHRDYCDKPDEGDKIGIIANVMGFL